MEREKACFKTTVGGQALMEGIMMRGPKKICVAVRRPDKTIELSYDTVVTHWWNRVPLVRGVCNMVDNLRLGYKYLMHSAEVSLGDEADADPESKMDLWLEAHPAAQKVVTGLSGVLGVAIALLLFAVLPTLVVGGINRVAPLGRWGAVVEGMIKMCIFILYLYLCTRMKEIHRVFQYHGAEHKTIACYEAGEELTVANIRKHSRFHPRCGTSFLVFVLILSIFLFSALPWDRLALRILLKILLLPLLMGISYELIKLAGRYDNLLTRIISTPGLWVQRLTTFEPEDDMIEVAIAAVTPVLPEKPEDGLW